MPAHCAMSTSHYELSRMVNQESKRKDKSTSYPEPFIVNPLGEHQQSLILLHGRGSTGQTFGEELLKSRFSSSPDAEGETLATALSNMKSIFPTAKRRRAKWYNRSLVHQRFDSVPIDEQDSRMSQEEKEWQLEVLRESGEFLKGIMTEELQRVGGKNVFIGGLSQGCAMALHFLLSYEGEIGGFVGISGWLPFVDEMEDILHPVKEGEMEDEDDAFAQPASGSDDVENSFDLGSPATEMRNFVRDNVDLSPINASDEPLWLKTPVFLGHGRNDGKVKIAKGLRVAELFKALRMQIVWKEYDEGHWYKVPEEIDDIVFAGTHDVTRKRRLSIICSTLEKGTDIITVEYEAPLCCSKVSAE